MQQYNRLSFYNEIRRNKYQSFFLIFVVLFVLLALSYTIALIVGGYYKSADLAIASVRAKKADEINYRQYHHLVEGISLASGLPKPKLYVMESPQINAFASGRDPKNAVICVTTGALEKLDKRELEGVLAHEMSHIANYDIRFMTLTAVLVGMIAIISEIFL